MKKKILMSCLLTSSTWCGLTQTSYSQTPVQYEIIDVSVQPCLDSWAKDGASEQSRKACLFSTATPTVKYEKALSKYGKHNKYTQYIAHALLRVSYYVTESYIALMPSDHVSAAWATQMCKYNAETMKLSRVPFNQLQPAHVQFVKDISPRLGKIFQVCQTMQ